MEETPKKRWSVTYTKHIKQKRKIYQDGFLDLQISTNKVKLFDECEKLLECRILTDEEVISRGDTLTFNAYLVDVGELEGKHMPMATCDLNPRGNESKFVRTLGAMHRQKFQSPVSSENGKDTIGKNKAGLHNLSPSQRIIKDFKMSEMQKYGMSQSITSTQKPNTTDWRALYTTQVTQKAKKYHDGFVQLAGCGTLGRQVMLYDANRNLLNSRFLKKDEVITSGESIALDGHLVEIGETGGDRKPLVDFQMNDHNIPQRIIQGETHCLENSSLEQEWLAMYTTQIRQKSNKYHDGILKLANCGSSRKKVSLFSEDNTILSSKFLGLSEEVKSGSTILLPKYTVDVGEPQKVNGSSKDADSNISICHSYKSNTFKRFQLKGTCSEENAHLNNPSTVKTEYHGMNHTGKSLRDAHQILSILQRPTVQESVVGSHADKMLKIFPGECKLPPKLVPSQGNTETVDFEMKRASDFISSKASSCFGSGEISNSTEDIDSNQTPLNSVIVDTECQEALSRHCAHGICDNQRKSCDQPENATRTMEDCPTFDLGF